MPYVNKPRPYKKEWAQEKKRDEKAPRAARARARRAMDAKGIDRTGKDIDHKKPLSRSKSLTKANAPSNLRLVRPSVNRSFSRNSDGSVKRNDGASRVRRKR
jgi:hypothetical protein